MKELCGELTFKLRHEGREKVNLKIVEKKFFMQPHLVRRGKVTAEAAGEIGTK